MPLNSELHALLQKAIVEYPPTFLRDGDVITHGFNAELDEYRALRDNSGSYIAWNTKRQKKVRTDIPNLRIEYNGKLGYFYRSNQSTAF